MEKWGSRSLSWRGISVRNKGNDRKPSENVSRIVLVKIGWFTNNWEVRWALLYVFSVAWSVVQGSITRPISDRTILESMRPARNVQTEIWEF